MDRLLTHSPTCPEPTKHSPLPDITWESFRNTLKRSKLNKGGGRDFRNNYTLHIPPPPIQQFIWRVCNHYPHQPLPEKWLEANIILLFKKGDLTNPVNYRPIALLNSVYKIIATHANRELLTAAIEHSIIHPTQFGGLPNRRCQDHIFNPLSTFRESVGSYSLYIDFNKAFNSVPHTTLFTVLSCLNFPTPLVNLIQSLYRAPRDFPVVSGHTHSSHLQTRGVRQGCPLSPILFCLYLNVLLFALPSHVTAPPSPHESGHAFVDDLLYRSEDGDRIQQILNFFENGRQGVGSRLKPQQNRDPCYGNSPPQNFHLPLGHPPINNQPEDGATAQLLQIPWGVHLHRQPRGTNTGIGQVGNTLLFHNPPTSPAHLFGLHSLSKRPTHPYSFLPPHGTPPSPERVGRPPVHDLAKYCT